MITTKDQVNPTIAIPPIDVAVPTITETATFALGWFWGPDAQFGSLPGVVRTRVGYTGGTKENPTYHSLGNHTETLQVDYDPTQISFEELLEIFWNSHNPTRRPWSQQYKSALFYHNEEQKALATKTKEQLAASKKSKFFSRKVYTEIIPATTFYLAEDYHQKYLLQNSPRIWGDILEIYHNPTDWINSTAAARLNGYVGGYATIAQLEDEIDSLGLSLPVREYLHEVVQRFKR